MREIAGAADIPGIGQHEAAGLVELAEVGALLGGGDGHGAVSLWFGRRVDRGWSLYRSVRFASHHAVIPGTARRRRRRDGARNLVMGVSGEPSHSGIPGSLAEWRAPR